MHISYSSPKARHQAATRVRVFERELKLRFGDASEKRQRHWLHVLAFWKRDVRADRADPAVPPSMTEEVLDELG
jgi:hypothetical protein